MATEAWYQQHKESVIKRTNAYQRLHREQSNEYSATHRNKRRSLGMCLSCNKPAAPGHKVCQHCLLKMQANGWVRRCKAVELLGGACAVCGQQDVRVLEFDHINNDGKQHRGVVGSGGNAMVAWIINNPNEAPTKLQVLCANCHALKRYERSLA